MTAAGASRMSIVIVMLQAPAERIENDGLDRIRMGLPERNKVTRTNTTGLRGVWPGYG